MSQSIRSMVMRTILGQKSSLLNTFQANRSYRLVMLMTRSLSSSPNSSSKAFDTEALDKMVKSDKVVVFMKGVPDEPRCGFSNAVVQVLRMHGVNFQSHDVLASEELRKAIKDYTSWPTIPQIFVDGQFIGGCDILLEKHQNGELVEDLSKVGIKSQLLEANNTEEPKK